MAKDGRKKVSEGLSGVKQGLGLSTQDPKPPEADDQARKKIKLYVYNI